MGRAGKGHGEQSWQEGQKQGPTSLRGRESTTLNSGHESTNTSLPAGFPRLMFITAPWT